MNNKMCINIRLLIVFNIYNLAHKQCLCNCNKSIKIDERALSTLVAQYKLYLN